MMNIVKNLKIGDRVNVVFSVGVAHPLYKTITEAEIIGFGGYNGHGILAKTIKPVYHPEDPKGIHVFDNDGNFIRYEVRPAFEKIWDGWVEEIVA